MGSRTSGSSTRRRLKPSVLDGDLFRLVYLALSRGEGGGKIARRAVKEHRHNGLFRRYRDLRAADLEDTRAVAKDSLGIMSVDQAFLLLKIVIFIYLPKNHILSCRIQETSARFPLW